MAQLKDSYQGGSQFQIKTLNGRSVELNTQRGEGGMKPAFSGKSDPGGTHPGYDGDNADCPSVILP